METIERELGAWHLPTEKCWQLPVGFPKLANVIAVIICPSSHCKCNSGATSAIEVLPLVTSGLDQMVRGGWLVSETVPQIVPVACNLRCISNGLPPVSSKMTSRLLDGFNHDLGIWYLKYIFFQFSATLFFKLNICDVQTVIERERESTFHTNRKTRKPKLKG